MAPLSHEQEQLLVDALISLDWMRDEDRKSREVIRRQLGCSMVDATEVLGYLYFQRHLIRPIYLTGEKLRRGVLAPKSVCASWTTERSRWKWEKVSK
jgi:hypothetical protein